MKLNKEQFLKSEFGSELEGVIKAWDIALQQSRNASETLRDLTWSALHLSAEYMRILKATSGGLLITTPLMSW